MSAKDNPIPYPRSISNEDPVIPWDYKPYSSGPLQSLGGKELCVYTHLKFNGGLGLSIITTPELAEEFQALQAVTFSESYERHLQPKLTDPASIKLTERTATSGRVMLAGKDYKRGDVIATERPRILGYGETSLSWEEREKLLEVAMSWLPTEGKGFLGELSSPEIVENSEMFGLAPYSRVMMTHAGSPVVVGGHMHHAVFPSTVAFLNHNCTPNAKYRIDPSTLIVSIRAARDIKEGEELTISYLTEPGRGVHFLPFEQRVARMAEEFGFDCACSRCRLGSATDAAIREMSDLQKSVEYRVGRTRERGPPSAAAVDDVLRLIKLYKKEGFDCFLDAAYGVAAKCFRLEVADRDNASKYAKLAIEVRSEFNGVVIDKDEKIQEWQKLVQKIA